MKVCCKTGDVTEPDDRYVVMLPGAGGYGTPSVDAEPPAAPGSSAAAASSAAVGKFHGRKPSFPDEDVSS